MKQSGFFGLILLLLVGCASQSLSVDQRIELYRNYVAQQEYKPITQIIGFKLHSWSYLSEEFILLSTSSVKPYLIEFRSRCRDLRFQQNIIVENSGSLLTSKFDSIRLPDGIVPNCYIKNIYPLTREQADELRELARKKPQ
ncbi:MAG: hypothetical protein HWE11_11180 [Gammaproteobacteria bacterium]|nr:hypothetical protein [Gammaproteobacteria bacterium]